MPPEFSRVINSRSRPPWNGPGHGRCSTSVGYSPAIFRAFARPAADWVDCPTARDARVVAQGLASRWVWFRHPRGGSLQGDRGSPRGLGYQLARRGLVTPGPSAGRVGQAPELSREGLGAQSGANFGRLSRHGDFTAVSGQHCRLTASFGTGAPSATFSHQGWTAHGDVGSAVSRHSPGVCCSRRWALRLSRFRWWRRCSRAVTCWTEASADATATPAG